MQECIVGGWVRGGGGGSEWPEITQKAPTGHERERPALRYPKPHQTYLGLVAPGSGAHYACRVRSGEQWEYRWEYHSSVFGEKVISTALCCTDQVWISAAWEKGVVAEGVPGPGWSSTGEKNEIVSSAKGP